MEIKQYLNYNHSDSERTISEKEALLKYVEGVEVSCIKCAHFTRGSQIDNGKCHVHYNRHDVHDSCDRFETHEQWAKRFLGKE